MARETRIGCCVPNRRRSSAVTGKLPMYSIKKRAPSSHTAVAKVHRQAISAEGIAVRRKISRKPSAVGENEFMRMRAYLTHNDIDQFAGENLLYDLFSGDVGLNFFFCQSFLKYLFLQRSRCNNHHTAKFPIDLHRNFDLFFFGEFGIV